MTGLALVAALTLVAAQARVIWRLRKELAAERQASGVTDLAWVGSAAREHLTRQQLAETGLDPVTPGSWAQPGVSLTEPADHQPIGPRLYDQHEEETEDA